MAQETTQVQQQLPTFHNPASLFDSIGKAYQEAFRDVPGQQRSLEWLLERLPSHSIKGDDDTRATVLDVGSGTGKPVAEILSSAGHAVTGIDLSPKMVELARKQVPAATFELTDAINYSPASQFDAVTSYFAFLDGMSRHDVKETLAKIASWIKPGGLFVYGTVPGNHEEEWSPWMGRMIQLTTCPKDTHLDMLKDNGLEILHWEEEKFQPHADTWEEDHLFIYAKKPA